MKQVAYLEPTPDARPITIWQVNEALERDPARWEHREFYSLVNRRPMRANFGRARAWHFAFKSGHAPTGSEGGGEGVTHEFAKAAICELGRIRFKSKNNNQFCLIRFSEIEEEWRFEDEGRQYAIDLVGTVCDPPQLAERWNGKLGIELVVSHPVGRTKKRALSKLNFPVVHAVSTEKAPERSDMLLSVLLDGLRPPRP